MNLSKNAFTEENIEILGRGISKNMDIEVLILEELHISYTGIASLCSGIGCMKNLKILALNDNLLGDSGIMFLSNVLIYTNQLQFLDISKNTFTHAPIPYLVSALLNLNYLKVFKIGENSIKDEGFVTLIKAVTTNIEELSLNKIDISSFGLEILCEKLPSFLKLQYLSLDYNNINQKSSKMLIDILPTLSLKHLSLVGCDVSSHRKALSLAKNCTEVLI